MTAVLAHALAVIRNRFFDGCVDEGQVAVAALYHDAGEILTGDMPTPIKYYNPAIREAYRQVEQVAADKLLGMLPEELRPTYSAALSPAAVPAQAALPEVKSGVDKVTRRARSTTPHPQPCCGRAGGRRSLRFVLPQTPSYACPLLSS